MTQNRDMKCEIVGGGPTGLVAALLLEQSGRSVAITERTPLADIGSIADRRSINLTLSGRGLRALEQAGIKNEVMGACQPLIGRRIHHSDGSYVSQYYGANKEARLFSIQRSTLSSILLKRVQERDGIQLRCGTEFESVDLAKQRMTVKLLNSEERLDVPYDALIACDGAFSRVRAELVRKEQISCEMRFFDWQYLSVTFAPEDVSSSDLGFIHFWSAPSFLLLAIPGLDRKLHANLLVRRTNNGTDIDRGEILDVVMSSYPSLRMYQRNFQSALSQNIFSSVPLVRLARWRSRYSAILIGDAAHASYFFFGQGLNANLDDAVCLASSIGGKAHCHSSIDPFNSVEAARRPEVAELQSLAELNFYRLRGYLTSAWGQAYEATKWMVLQRCLGRTTDYDLVTDGSMSILAALKIVRYRDLMFKLCGGALLAAIIAFWTIGVRWVCRLCTVKVSQDKQVTRA